MPRKVFYAWQSDRNQATCRFFIRDALKLAIKKIAKGMTEGDVDEAERPEKPELDHDRKGVSGMVRIAAVIEEKIKTTPVFVADLTVNEPVKCDDGRTKQSPNANVLIELGLAFGSISARRCVAVMNTAFGPPEELPFDLLGISHPVTYDLKSADDPELKTKREALAEELVGPIKECLKHYDEEEGVRSAAAQAARQAAQDQFFKQLSDRRDKLMAKLDEGEFHGVPGTVKAGLTVVPIQGVKIPITRPSEYILDFQPLWHASGTNWGNESRSIVFTGMDHANRVLTKSEVLSATEVFDDGFVFAGMDGGLELIGRSNKTIAELANWKDVPPAEIPLAMIQKYVIGCAMGYMTTLRNVFKYAGPFAVSFVISGLKGHKIRTISNAEGHHRPKPCQQNTMGGEWHLVPADANVSDMQTVAKLFEDDLRAIWRHAGFADNVCWRDGKYIPREQ